MSVDASLVERCRKELEREDGLTEKNMFGGLSFLLAGKMICGVLGSRLVVRLDPGQAYEEALREPHVTPMDFTGKPMRGFVYVDPKGLAHVASLRKWLKRAVAFGTGAPPKSRTRQIPRDAGSSESRQG